MSVERKQSNHTESSGGVDSVENVDGSLTISPETGNVVAILNVANANTWTADQSFNDNVTVTLGTGGDADIFYDSGDLIFDAEALASGPTIIVTGDILNPTDSTYTVGEDSSRFLNAFMDQCRSVEYRASASNLLGVGGSFVIIAKSVNSNYSVTRGLVTGVSKMGG